MHRPTACRHPMAPRGRAPCRMMCRSSWLTSGPRSRVRKCAPSSITHGASSLRRPQHTLASTYGMHAHCSKQPAGLDRRRAGEHIRKRNAEHTFSHPPACPYNVSTLVSERRACARAPRQSAARPRCRGGRAGRAPGCARPRSCARRGRSRCAATPPAAGPARAARRPSESRHTYWVGRLLPHGRSWGALDDNRAVAPELVAHRARQKWRTDWEGPHNVLPARGTGRRTRKPVDGWPMPPRCAPSTYSSRSSSRRVRPCFSVLPCAPRLPLSAAPVCPVSASRLRCTTRSRPIPSGEERFAAPVLLQPV